jgi:hypothetical protein
VNGTGDLRQRPFDMTLRVYSGTGLVYQGIRLYTKIRSLSARHIENVTGVSKGRSMKRYD